MKVALDKLVARPGYAPASGQTVRPWDSYLGSKPPVGASEDLTRILALPRRPVPDALTNEAMIALMTERHSRHRKGCGCALILAKRGTPRRPCLDTLRDVQAWALYEIGLYRGLLGVIGVGHGKTVLDILTPMALGLGPSDNAVLLIPPTLVSQLVAEYELLAEHFHVPSLVVQAPGSVPYLKPGRPALNVLPYSRLSRPESTEILEKLRPVAIIADEGHRLRHPDTATTSRVIRYFQKHPDTLFFDWTGSITDSSITEYSHLSALALKEGSPLPIDPMVSEEWARALDASDWPAPPGELLRMCNAGEHVRQGFGRRLLETPGVVSTTAAAVSAELRLVERTAPAIPANVTQALDGVRSTWVRPDGEELVEPLAVARCCHELAAGFYYRWVFPRGESQALITEWFEKRKAWRKEMRGVLVSRQPHLDSPMLVTAAAMRAWGDMPMAEGLPAWQSRTWPAWRDVKDLVRPETEAVRISDYLARDAAKWADENLGIVWYAHRAFGEWVAEISGLPLHAGGTDAGQKIAAETGERSIVASIKSHGTGRDGLQRLYWTQLVACPPSKNEDWEQLLGRLHRIGQASPVVEAQFYRHTPELVAHIDQAVARALYVYETTNAVQKISVGFQ